MAEATHLWRIDDQEVGYLRESVLSSRKAFGGRVLPMIVITSAFSPIVGWQIALAWLLTALFVSEVVSRRLEDRVRKDAPPPHWPLQMITCSAVYQVVLGSIAVAAALKGGLWGVMAGEMFLMILAVLLMSSGLRSVSNFYAAFAPLIVCLLIVDGLSFIKSDSMAGPLCLCTGALVLPIYARRIWLSNLQLMARLDEARTTAEASTAAKSAFVAMVSHELRTPLSGILAGAAQLDRTAADTTTKSSAMLVIQAAQMMRVLLNDLLDNSKIEAGRMQVEVTDFDLRSLMLDTVRFWRPELQRKRLFLRISGARRLPQWVAGDAVRLRQILNNLISNSVKFTETGGLGLHFSITDAPGESLSLTVDVSDTGPGMTEAQQSLLFNAFEQLGASTARTHGGTGLGLHISRELSRLMGGDISVISAPGVGATFRVHVVLARGESPMPVNDAVAGIDGDQQLRLLIVDDHEVNRLAFSLMLEPITQEIVVAENGAQALEALSLGEFDVVLMDINMPGMSGIEVTNTLRANAGPNRYTPVIALTGSASPREINSYLAAGMKAFVMKPVTATELLAAIDEVLSSEAPLASTGTDASLNLFQVSQQWSTVSS